MAFINDKDKEINCKVVFYGPALCGKSTSLRFIHQQVNRSKDVPLTLSDEGDRTLFFDFVPVSLGKIKDYSIRVHLYTVPGQKAYEQSRKLISKGLDGVVFMADSDLSKMEQNIGSLNELRNILKAESIDWPTLPKVFQYNKRDLPTAVPVEELSTLLNKERDPEFETVAIKGLGLFDVLSTISEKVLLSLKQHQ
jgi:signal recognition particle receptor subunit beta